MEKAKTLGDEGLLTLCAASPHHMISAAALGSSSVCTSGLKDPCFLQSAYMKALGIHHCSQDQVPTLVETILKENSCNKIKQNSSNN